MVSLAKLERRHFFSWHDGKSKEHSSGIFAARQLADGGSAQLLPNARGAREGAEKPNEVAGTMRILPPKAQISVGEAAVMFTNALSVKLRGSHAA